MRILVIGNWSMQDNAIAEELERNGFSLALANDDIASGSGTIEDDYALVLLNLTRPGLDGPDIVQSVRRKTNAPLLVLTERDSVEARIAGLKSGVNDYLVKPFSSSELLARVKALSRPAAVRDRSMLRLADLEVDERSGKCFRNRIDLGLARQEFELLKVMLRHQGKMLSRAQLTEQVWGIAFNGKTNMVEVAILRLRSKLDVPFKVKLLHTVRSGGYVLEERPWA